MHFNTEYRLTLQFCLRVLCSLDRAQKRVWQSHTGMPSRQGLFVIVALHPPPGRSTSARAHPVLSHLACCLPLSKHLFSAILAKPALSSSPVPIPLSSSFRKILTPLARLWTCHIVVCVPTSSSLVCFGSTEGRGWSRLWTLSRWEALTRSALKHAPNV